MASIDHNNQFYVNLLFNRSIYRPMCTHMGYYLSPSRLSILLIYSSTTSFPPSPSIDSLLPPPFSSPLPSSLYFFFSPAPLFLDLPFPSSLFSSTHRLPSAPSPQFYLKMMVSLFPSSNFKISNFS